MGALENRTTHQAGRERLGDEHGRAKGLLSLWIGLLACNTPGEVEGAAAPPSEDEQRCDAARVELTNTCFLPGGGDVNEDSDRPSILDIEAAAEPLNGGYFLPRVDAGEATGQAGFVLEDNDVCRVSCVVPCDLTKQSLCVTSLAPPEGGAGPSGCMYCGEATREQCQSLIDACE